MNAQDKTRELIEAGQREVVLDDQRLEHNRARVLARVAAVGVVAAGVSASSSVAAAGSAGAAGNAALGAAAASKAAASFSVAKLVVAVVVVGGSVTGTYALTTRTQTEPQPQQTAKAPPRAPVPLAVPAPAAPEVDTESSLAPTESEPPDVAKSVPAPHAGASKPQASAKNLSEHADLLRDARAALSAGNAARALSLLDGHREVARGPLGQEWAAARILVLCRLGRVAEAKQAGARFLKSHASSPLAAQVAASCAAD